MKQIVWDNHISRFYSLIIYTHIYFVFGKLKTFHQFTKSNQLSSYIQKEEFKSDKYLTL